MITHSTGHEPPTYMSMHGLNNLYNINVQLQRLDDIDDNDNNNSNNDSTL